MGEPTELNYGAEPGMRFACLLDGKGGARHLDWRQVREWTPEHGVLWVHLERDDDASRNWLLDDSGIDPVVCAALSAGETRPRVKEVNGGLLMVLRGVSVHRSEDGIDLVPVHLWVDRNRVVSLRDKEHSLRALREIRGALDVGNGPAETGKLFVKIVRKIVKHIDPMIATLDDEVDDLDERRHETGGEEFRASLGQLRRRATNIRRYLAPQREALKRLHVVEVAWLGKPERVHLREAADVVLRSVENLDAIRDRTTILHEELSALVSERISKTSHRLTTVAVLLLPPSLLAAVLGANVGGVPGYSDSGAFAIVCLIVVALMAFEVWLLRRMRWL